MFRKIGNLIPLLRQLWLHPMDSAGFGFWAIFFLICLAFVSVYGITALIKGDWQTVQNIAGVKTVEEEIDEETHV